MAKRTNKTDHVLNLLSGNEEKKDAPEKQNVKVHPPVDPENAVSVIDPMDEEAKLADEIRKSLESGLEKETEDALEEMEAPKINPEVSEQRPEEENTDIPEKAEPESTDIPEKAESEGTDIPEKAQQENEEDEFVFLNVMQTLVEEKAANYMEQFGVCTCSRCKADVTALALTKLPAKYVVVNRTAVSPLINFYSSKYAGQITVEITKACIRVNEVPHHNRD
ncbi:late competence development ComFB family protein [Muricomes intestini]|jgi:competence protein ComFB|uniref:Late competence development protein ComFB n=2 Tax=Muricomes intestini TaxID=1796634 RepID=A0A4R3KH57_9FIRM|nr:late competence development ComFB family protein [Muricomes intestini]TCS82800.1 late competence development protein ComFB [Muricomes intestini]